MGGLARRAVRLALLTVVAAWVLDRWLRDQVHRAAPAPIRASVGVSAPIDRVWTVLADIENQPAWMHDLKEVRLTSPPPVGVGTRATGRVQVFGVGVDDPVEITTFEAPTHFAIRHLGLITGSGDIRLTAEDDGTTTVTWDETLVSPILPHLGGLILAMVFRPIFQRDLERLAGLVETG